MPSLTWNPKNSLEVESAERVYEVYARHKFTAQHNGKTIRKFDARFGSLTFERIRTSFSRLMDEDGDD